MPMARSEYFSARLSCRNDSVLHQLNFLYAWCVLLVVLPACQRTSQPTQQDVNDAAMPWTLPRAMDVPEMC